MGLGGGGWNGTWELEVALELPKEELKQRLNK